MGQNDDGWAAIGRRLAELREAGGLSQTGLADRIPYNRPKIVQAEGGTLVPIPEKLLAGADRVLVTGGELARMRETLVTGQAREVGPTLRRTFVKGVPAVVAAGFSTAAHAARWSDAIARADPTPRELRALQAGVQQLAGSYYSTPLPELLPRAEDGWTAVHEILEKPVSDTARRELRKVAGRYTFYLAHIAFDLGDNRVAQDYLSLASQHAEAAGDTLVLGSIVVLDSSMAYFGGDNQSAADIAAEALDTGDVHPYVLGMLSACRARAAALCAGRQDEARAALDTMQNAIWTGEILPGCKSTSVTTATAQTAVVLGHLGEGERAEEYARQALELAHRAGERRTAGGTSNALARALLRRAEPEPEQAARVVIDAFGAVDGQPTGWVIGPARKLHGELERHWPGLAGVRELGEVVAESRRALSPARQV